MKSKYIQITQESLKEIFEYDAATGVFKWLIRPSHAVQIGDIAGHVSKDGYVLIGISRRLYKAHRLAWIYVTGEFPMNEIDHKNGVRSDNAFENLRELSHSGNQQNLRNPKSNNTSGYLGVWKNGNGWSSKIRSAGKAIHLGTFNTPDLAHLAYVEAKRKLHQFNTI